MRPDVLLLGTGVVGSAFLLEYAWRRARFRDQPYRNLGEFVRKLAALDPTFWRGLAR